MSADSKPRLLLMKIRASLLRKSKLRSIENDLFSTADSSPFANIILIYFFGYDVFQDDVERLTA